MAAPAPGSTLHYLFHHLSIQALQLWRPRGTGAALPRPARTSRALGATRLQRCRSAATAAGGVRCVGDLSLLRGASTGRRNWPISNLGLRHAGGGQQRCCAAVLSRQALREADNLPAPIIPGSWQQLRILGECVTGTGRRVDREATNPAGQQPCRRRRQGATHTLRTIPLWLCLQRKNGQSLPHTYKEAAKIMSLRMVARLAANFSATQENRARPGGMGGCRAAMPLGSNICGSRQR